MKKLLKYELLLTLVLLITVVAITGYELKLLGTYLLIDKMVTEDTDYTAFRKMQISEAAIQEAEVKVMHLYKRKPQLKESTYIDRIGYLTYSMMAWDYNLTKESVVDEKTFLRGIAKVVETNKFKELYGYYQAVLNDLQYFPVPAMDGAEVTYGNSWNEPRTYGGNRTHEGTDLMDSNNLRGYFPVISITDGIVEKLGWLDKGGYRIGVRSDSGGYFYYAHLYSYAPEIKTGDRVIAGQLLGFMGDSGYGSEGTIGKFDVHLHLGIYVNKEMDEMSINPYWILKVLEKNRTKYN